LIIVIDVLSGATLLTVPYMCRSTSHASWPIGGCRTGAVKVDRHIVAPGPTGTCAAMNAGWERSKSRSSALLWLAVTTRGASKLTFTGTVRLPELPSVPLI